MNRREGFWASEHEPNLPKVSEGEPWAGIEEFLHLLEITERSAKRITYRGWSYCRICNEANGSCEFYVDGWTWPSGYRHYIQDHNVRPSSAFQEFILGKEVK